MQQDYISQIWNRFKKVESVSFKSEDEQTDAINTILENLKRFKYDFEKKILEPARSLQITPDVSTHKLGDKSNPHIRAIYRVEEAISNLEDQLKMQLADPFKEEDETGADAPAVSDDMDLADDIGTTDLGGTLESAEVEESYNYYNKMHPEKNKESDVLQLNGWNYSNGEIWDEQGVCSISYDPEQDKILVNELSDPDGVDQELIATCNSVDELDDALVNFAELSELAPEMKERFAEYVEEQRHNAANEDISDLLPKEDPMEAPAEDTYPTIVDDWEYLESDPEFNGNPTLLYDKGNFVVFIQKDADSSNPQPYYASTLDGDESQEHVTADLNSLCKWLEVNELPVPTEDAKFALEGAVHEAEEKKDKKAKEADCCKKLPKGMKCVKDDPSTTTLAPAMKKPTLAKIEEIKAKKK